MTKPEPVDPPLMIWKGDFAIPVEVVEAAAARGPLDEPYPWFYLPFEGMSGEQEADEAWAEIMLGGTPDESASQSAATSDGTTAPNEPQRGAAEDSSSAREQLQIKPGYGPPYDVRPQGTETATAGPTSDATMPASAEPREPAADKSKP